MKYSSRVTKLVALELIENELKNQTKRRALEMLLKTMLICECRCRVNYRFDPQTGSMYLTCHSSIPVL